MRTLLIVALGAATALALAVAGMAANGHANYHAVCPTTPSGAHCNALVVTDAQGNPAASTGPSGYGPAEFHGAYSLPNTGSGAPWVAVVDAYDDPTAEQDLATYSAQYGLPSCTTANGCFKQVGQTGTHTLPAPDAGWALEISLDIQMVHAICQNCRIALIEANSSSVDDLLTAEDLATSHTSVVSNSWGGSESFLDTSWDSHFQKANKAITFAAGDSGYGAEYPAASPYVTAVGGTTLTLSGTSRASETVWSGTGSGCSFFEPKQSWQTDSGCSKRTVADVAADADPNTGAAVYDSYGYQGQSGWFQVGGTSLAAPLIAGVYALAGNENLVGFGAYPYSHSSSLYDVTSGSNGSCGGSYLCTATTGYDGPTGLGSPNGLGGF